MVDFISFSSWSILIFSLRMLWVLWSLRFSKYNYFTYKKEKKRNVIILLHSCGWSTPFNSEFFFAEKFNYHNGFWFQEVLVLLVEDHFHHRPLIHWLGSFHDDNSFCLVAWNLGLELGIEAPSFNSNVWLHCIICQLILNFWKLRFSKKRRDFRNSAQLDLLFCLFCFCF